jgi:DNA-binding NtrC family response regulator
MRFPLFSGNSARSPCGSLRATHSAEAKYMSPRNTVGCPGAEDDITVLVVVTRRRAAELQRILSHTRWQVYFVNSKAEASRVLATVPISVVLCEERLPDGTWLAVMCETQGLSPSPPTIVFSALATPTLWAEVLNYGAYDLLADPIEPRELYTLVRMAWHHYTYEDRVQHEGRGGARKSGKRQARELVVRESCELVKVG